MSTCPKCGHKFIIVSPKRREGTVTEAILKLLNTDPGAAFHNSDIHAVVEDMIGWASCRVLLSSLKKRGEIENPIPRHWKIKQ